MFGDILSCFIGVVECYERIFVCFTMTFVNETLFYLFLSKDLHRETGG